MKKGNKRSSLFPFSYGVFERKKLGLVVKIKCPERVRAILINLTIFNQNLLDYINCKNDAKKYIL